MLPEDYNLVVRPYSIKLTCPYCDSKIEIPFTFIIHESDLRDIRSYAYCTECEGEIELGLRKNIEILWK